MVVDPYILLDKVTHREVTCHACPYGAQCDGVVIAKPNFWGAPSA